MFVTITSVWQETIPQCIASSVVYKYPINIWTDSWLTSVQNKDNKINQESIQTLLCGLFLSIAGWGYLCQNVIQKLLRWVFKTWFSTIYSNNHDLITIKIHWRLVIEYHFGLLLSNLYDCWQEQLIDPGVALATSYIAKSQQVFLQGPSPILLWDPYFVSSDFAN